MICPKVEEPALFTVGLFQLVRLKALKASAWNWPHPVYPAERQAVFLCRAGVEEVSRGIPRIDGCFGSRDFSHGDGGGG